MNKQEKKILFKFLDGSLTDFEKKEYERLVKTSSSFQEEKRDFEKMRRFIVFNSEKSAGDFFEDKILNKLNRTALLDKKIITFDELLIISFRKIFAPALILILLLISFNFISTGEISINSALGIPNMSIETALNPTFDLAME